MEIVGWNITKLLTVMIRMFNYFGFNQKNTDKHRILQDVCSCRLLQLTLPHRGEDDVIGSTSRDPTSSTPSFSASLPVRVTWFAAAAVASAVVITTVYVITRLYIESSLSSETATTVAGSSALYYRYRYRQATVGVVSSFNSTLLVPNL